MNFATYFEKERSADKLSVPAARYYLLDGDFRVISAKTGEENSPLDASLFDLFPANRVLREEIATYVRSYPHDVLLTLCGRTPVLFVGTLFAQTGLVLAILPVGEVKKTLSAPAAFHHAPAQLCVSASAQMRYKAHDEAAFAAASRWLTAVSAPFVFAQSAQRELSSVLAFCASRLSALLQTPFSCDLSGLPALSCAGIQTEFAVGVMLATLLAASRAASAHGARLCAVLEGTPTLYLEYTRADLTHTPREFSRLLACAAARGAVLDVVFSEENPHLVQVRACIGVVELSAQGVRERHRFLAGRSPLSDLPVSHAISPSFPELSFD